MKVGLRIDVDTVRGTREGVPQLCRLLASHGLRATFFFSVGPDNMGRNLWRLLNPAFLRKVIRSNAPGLYGWDILLSGAFGPGPVIGKQGAEAMRAATADGHEIGFHAWDHYAWQRNIDRMRPEQIRESLHRGVDLLTRITGHTPTCSAVPGWRATDAVLAIKAEFPFAFNSDCRGDSIFLPVVDGQTLSQPQIPVNLPTYDEVINQQGIHDGTYNDYILSLLDPDHLMVLTVHTEVEGLSRHALFKDFLEKAHARGVTFCCLGDLLPAQHSIEPGAIVQREIAGREGWVAVQSPAVQQPARWVVKDHAVP